MPEQETLLPAHSDIVRRGQSVDSACLVVEGFLARIRDTSSGRRQITAFYLPGEMPDLDALLVPSALATLLALSPVRIQRVPRAAMRDAIARYPAIGEALWRQTIMDGMIAMEWVANIGQRQARARIAHLICEVAIRSRAVAGEQFDFAFPVTQTHIAEATGMSPVHVNRSVQALRAERALELVDGRAFVRNWALLQDIAEFEGSYLDMEAPVRLLA